jgi:hypothetical protein
LRAWALCDREGQGLASTVQAMIVRAWRGGCGEGRVGSGRTCMESRRTLAWCSTMLCVLGLINFYNIPYAVFVVLLRAFLWGSSTPTAEIPNALRTHTVLVTGAVASLGYGAVCCTFLLQEVRSHEHLAPVFGVPLLALVLGQIASVPLTMAVFAVGLFHMRRVLRPQQRAVPTSSPGALVQGVLVEMWERRSAPAVVGGARISDHGGLEAAAECDAALFTSEAIAFAQSYEDIVRERALEYMEAALSQGAGRDPRASVGTASVNWASINWAAVRGAAVVAQVLERLPAVAGRGPDGTAPAHMELPNFTSVAPPNLLVPAATSRVALEQHL